MENNNKTEKLIEELSRYVNQSLLFVETKHASIIAFCAIILGEVVEHISIKIDFNDCMFYIKGIPFIIAFIALLYSMITSLYAFYPPKAKEKQNKKSEKKIEKGTNLFRCETLECFSEEELAHYLMAENEENPLDCYEKEVIKHIITTSKAAARKYRMFRISIKKLIFSTFIFCVIALLDKLNII